MPACRAVFSEVAVVKCCDLYIFVAVNLTVGYTVLSYRISQGRTVRLADGLDSLEDLGGGNINVKIVFFSEGCFVSPGYFIYKEEKMREAAYMVYMRVRDKNCARFHRIKPHNV